MASFCNVGTSEKEVLEKTFPDLFRLVVNDLAPLLPDTTMREIFIDINYYQDINNVAARQGLSFIRTCQYYQSAIEILKEKQDLLTFQSIPLDFAKQLAKPLKSLQVNTRAANCFLDLNLHTVEDLLSYIKPIGVEKLKKCRRLGDKTVEHIKLALIKEGLIDEDGNSHLFGYVL